MKFKIKNTQRNHIFFIEDYNIEKNFETIDFYKKYGLYDKNKHDFIKYYTCMIQFIKNGEKPLYIVEKVVKQ